MRKALFALAIGIGVLYTLSDGPLNAEDYDSQILKLLIEEKFDEVTALAQARIEQDPTHCETYKYLAQASEKKQDKIAEVTAYLEGLREQDPRNPCIDYALGLCLKNRAQYAEALTRFQTAIKTNPQYYGAYVEAGWIHHSLRDFEEARKSYQAAVEIAGKSNNPGGEAEARIRLGILYLHYGNPDKALKYLSEALNLSRGIKRPDQEATALARMATALLGLGEIAEAETKGREALEASKTLGAWRRTYAYQTLGTLHMAHGDAVAEMDRAQSEYQKAISHYNEAFHITPYASHKLMLRALLGNAYLRSGEHAIALQYYESFLREAPAEDRALKATRSLTLGFMGEIFLKRGDYAQALGCLKQAIRFAREDKNKRIEMSLLKQVGDVYAEKGEYEKAREYYDQVLQEVKDRFIELGPEPKEERYVFFEDEFKVYEALISLLMKMQDQHPEKDYAREAFNYVEGARAQAMFQMLFKNRIVEKLLQEAPRDPFLNKLANLQEQVNRLHRARIEKQALIQKLNTKDSDQIQSMQNDVKAQEAEIEGLNKRIVSLVKSRLRDYDTANMVNRIQQEVIEDTEVVIEYMVTEEKTFVFLIAKDAFHTVTIPRGRKEYRATQAGAARVESIAQLMQRVSAIFPLPDQALSKRPRSSVRGADIQLRALNDLYEALFQPIEKHLRAGNQLIIVPDDVLYYAPFEMLVTRFQRSESPQYLLSRYPISYVYAAGLLRRLSHTPDIQSQASLLIGNPDFSQAKATPAAIYGGLESARFLSPDGRLAQLPYAEQEIHRIRRVIRNPLLLMGTQATEAAFKRNAAGAGIIHIATHSIFDRFNYLDSKIVFALGERIDQQGEDGLLYLHEIMNLNLKANLVVLTGCETGLGRLRRGGGLEGISRAFLSAGVPSVIGTLWSVSDSEATANLMTNFYKHLSQGRNKREALQRAKLDLLAGGEYADPFYWAAPILIGDTAAAPAAKSASFSPMMLLAPLPLLLLLLYFIRNRGMRR